MRNRYSIQLRIVLFLIVIVMITPSLMGLSGRRIGLDPGHGHGVNQGVYIAEGTWVLDGAFRARTHLQNHGATVIMTRTTGANPALSTRVNILNSNNAHRSVSIHSNAASAAATGMEAFYCSLNPYPSTSQTLANQLRLRSLSMVHNANRGTKECLDAGRGFHFTMVRSTNHPTALPEYYFHTNSWENYNLHYLASGRENIARSLYAAICDNYGVQPTFEQTPSTKFSAGDWVRTTADPTLNLRSGPGTDYSIIKALPLHSVAQVQSHADNGIYRTNNYWWRVQVHECGTYGWLAEYYLESTSAPVCHVSMPHALNGPLTGQTHQSHTYSTGGSTCSNGHAVQYYYNWGDGTGEGWTSNTSASKTWTAGGIYDIRTRARCATTHTQSEATPLTTVTMHHLNRIEINGPVALPLNTTYQYQAEAFYNDGSSSTVNPEWSLTLEPYLHETFDSYSSQAMFEAAWPVLTGNGLTLTTERAQTGSGGRSVKQDHTAHANVKNLGTGYHGTDSEPLVLEFWMYDSEPTLTNARHFISLAAWGGGAWGSGSLENLLAMGIYNFPHESGEYYKVRTVEGGVNWAAGTIARSTGWRNMKIRVLSDTVEFYIDNQLASEDNYSPPSIGWNSIRLGSGLISTDQYEVYYDNLKLYTEAAPDSGIAQINANGELTTFNTPANIRVSATYNESPTTRDSSQMVALGGTFEIMIEDFESYADTNALRTRWQSGGNDYGWSVITLQSSGGAEDSGQFLEMTDAGWLAVTEATFNSIVPYDGSFSISFYYMNGHKDSPIDNRLNFEVYRGEALLSQTQLQTTVIDQWTHVETDPMTLFGGDSLRIRIDGNTNATRDVAFALDQIRLAEIESVAAPVFNPSPGTYSTPQDVLISCATPGAVIHYTTDGSDPANSGTVISGNPGESVLVNIPMYSTRQIRAYASHSEWDDSPETSGTFTIQAELTALQIEGPSELSLNTAYQYTARAFYSDGTVDIVTADWDLNFDIPETIELFTENFTGYANQAAFESAWTPHASGSLQLSTVQARSTQSTMQDHTVRANYYALEDSYQGSDEMPLVLEFWMYDSDSALTNARHFISLASYSGGAWGSGTLENLVALGIHNFPDAATKYKARTLYGDSNWVATSIDRAAGWRKMTIRLLSSSVEYYVDGSLAYQGAYTVPATGWNAIRLGSELSSTHLLNVYYDDLSLYQEIDSSYEPATINSSGELTTGHLAAEGTLSAAFTDGGITRTASMNITILPLEVLVTELAILGDTEIERNTDYQYYFEAKYSDGSTALISPSSWFIRHSNDFLEDFSSYSTQSEFEQAWPLLSESVSALELDASLQPPTKRGKSVKHDENSRAQIYNLSQPLMVSEDNTVVFSFWMYDAHPTVTNIRNFISFASFSGGFWGAGELENLIALGVHRDPSSDKYNTRILEGGTSEHEQGWDDTSMVRKRGWNFAEIHLVYPNICQFYINGNLVHEDSYTEPLSGWNSIRLGSGLTSTHSHEIWYSEIFAGVRPNVQLSESGILRIVDNETSPSSFFFGPYYVPMGNGEPADEEYELGAVYTEDGITVGGVLDITASPPSIKDWYLY